MDETPKKKKSRWRWVRRAAGGLVLVMLVLAAMPFLFTTQVVRWAVGRSDYGRFSPEIGSASLSPGGKLTLRNVVLHELAPHGEKLLVKVPRLAVTFSWWGVLHSRVQDIELDDVTVYVRPEEPASPAVTLMELTSAADGKGGAGSANSAAPAADPDDPADPFWFDSLSCEGRVQVEAFAELNIPAESVPLKLAMQMRGDRRSPARDLTMSLGDRDGKPQARARLRFEPQAGGQRIAIENCTALGLHAGLSQAFASRLLAKWPKMFQQALEAEVGTFAANGTIDRVGGEATFSGRVEIGGASIVSKAGAATPVEIRGVAVSGSAGGALGAAFLSGGTVSEGHLSIDDATVDKNKVEHFQTPLTLGGGVIEASQVKASFDGGDFAGRVRFSAVQKMLLKADFTVQHLDQKQVAANLAPDRIEAEGTVSGTISLASKPKGGLGGMVDLRSDGPGLLQIKDAQTAEMLAKQLQTPEGTGVLPANFSDIVVQQLKDYPYKTAHIQLSDREGVPVVTLEYVRQPVKAGEPGFGVPVTIAGQKVLANYTIQLPGVTIVLQGMTIEELLSRATGLMEQISGPKGGK